jgi:hypothetical protein
MRISAIVALVGMVLTLAACGASSQGGANLNGTWTATLSDTNGTEAFAFTTALIATGASGTLTINSFQFSTNSPCFVSGETESGTFTLSGNFNGKVSGSFGMNVRSGSPAGNTLTLMGTVSGNTVSGTWTLSGGSGCSGSGNFTMVRM